MAEENNTQEPRDKYIDTQWRKITQQLHDVDTQLPPVGSGPRDWVAAPSPDEAFNPNQLPPPPDSEPHSRSAQIMLWTAVILFCVSAVSFLKLATLPSGVTHVCGFASLILCALALYKHLPTHRDPDDDGIML